MTEDEMWKAVSQNDDAIIDIEYSVGFEGLSSFYSFKKGLKYHLWYIER
ncbi:hypothetical protein [Terrisporobacter petrolearius]